jgi:hypothetical protein
MIRYFIATLILFVGSCSSKNKSPCKLLATYKATLPGSFNFREDNSFEWTNGFTSQTEGHYIWEGNIITLDRIGFDKFIKTKRLLITTTHPISGIHGKYLVQVDDKNNLIDSMHTFTVNIDTRDSIK